MTPASRLRHGNAPPRDRNVVSTERRADIAWLLPLFLLVHDVGLYDRYWGVILPHAAMHITFFSWVGCGFFAGVPVDTEEATLIDGSSWWGAFLRVALPQVVPGMLALGMHRVAQAPGFTRRTAINLSGGLNELTDGTVYRWTPPRRRKSVHIGNPGYVVFNLDFPLGGPCHATSEASSRPRVGERSVRHRAVWRRRDIRPR